MLTKFFKGMTLDHISQRFHEGHKAWDVVGNNINFGYGTPLCAPEICRVEEIIGDTFTPDDHSNLERGHGVRLKGLETGYEYLYWHTLPTLPVWGGDIVPRGGIVAFMGNAGLVRVGGNYVPLEERNQEPYKGTHLHIRVTNNGVPIDPLPLVRLDWEPNYSFLDLVKAITVVVEKTIKLIS